MTETIENLFTYGAFLGSLLPICFFLFFYFKKQRLPLFLLLAFYSFIELSTNYIAWLEPSPKVFRIVYAAFTILEFSIITRCFVQLIPKRTFRNIAFLAIPLFTAFAITYSIVTHFKGTDSIPIGVETIIILAFSFYFLYREMEKTSQVLIYNRYTFWVVSGIMLYLSGSLFIYLFASRIEESAKNQFWMFANAFTMLKYFFFVISVVVANKSIKLKTSNPYYPI